MKHACLASIVLLAHAVVALAGDAPVISPAHTENGILVHDVESEYQAGKTKIRVLLPDRLVTDKRYRVIYVLPVEALNGHQFGDGLLEVKTHDLQNKHRAIFVAPTFSHLPWYADHPTDPSIRQETYLLKVVLPLVERTYPAKASCEGRLLLGFSKSGWGAWSLVVRHPETFARAVAWDAPLMMDRLGKYGSTAIFGTEENFARYQLSTALVAGAERLRGRKRLDLLGYGGFRQDHEQVHLLLDQLRVKHTYRDGPQRKHDWHSGWVPEAVELLVAEDR